MFNSFFTYYLSKGHLFILFGFPDLINMPLLLIGLAMLIFTSSFLTLGFTIETGYSGGQAKLFK
jgi:hypothetical protein